MKKLLILFSFFLIALTLLKNPHPTNDQKLYYFSSDLQNLNHFTFGQRFSMSDNFWLQFVQGASLCEGQTELTRIISCLPTKDSWAGHVVMAIIALDDKYLAAHEIGGLMLTFLIKDYPGATLVFDKAVERFPHNWPLVYKAAYHSQYHEIDLTKAAERYELAGQNGAPSWTHALAVKLLKGGNMDTEAMKLYESFKDKGLPDYVLKNIREQLHIKE